MISKKDEKILRKLLTLATETEEALTYGEMRGFLFGLAITPDVILPSEWMPVLFGEEMFTLDSEQEGQRFLDTLMRVVNDLTRRFHEGSLRFPFDLANLGHEDELLPVQEWVYGLNEAMLLRPECWFEEELPEPLSEEQEELFTSLSVIQGIAHPLEAGDLFAAEFAEEEDQVERLLASLFVMLPVAVETIMAHAFVLEEERQASFQEPRIGPPQPLRSDKIGRNEPCPCGSGKKYKKCCLRKEKIVPIH